MLEISPCSAIIFFIPAALVLAGLYLACYWLSRKLGYFLRRLSYRMPSIKLSPRLAPSLVAAVLVVFGLFAGFQAAPHIKIVPCHDSPEQVAYLDTSPIVARY